MDKTGKDLCPSGAYNLLGKTEIITEINIKLQMWSAKEKNKLGQPLIMGCGEFKPLEKVMLKLRHTQTDVN